MVKFVPMAENKSPFQCHDEFQCRNQPVSVNLSGAHEPEENSCHWRFSFGTLAVGVHLGSPSGPTNWQ